ncbi:alpha-glucan family phosphorylase [Candidatus Woesebacteria bacterium]|nr:alpha-glucan family phosphorylase [Candidatus Woesebacteria bacterium]
MNTTISKQHPIAYLCAEYGVATELPIYAGGFGVLAGDTVKAAADMAMPFVAVGLLYRGHGVVQHLSPEGLQTEGDYYFDPLENGLEHVYVDEEPLFIKVHLTELDVWLRVWRKDLDNGVSLYLLDSETDQNELVERDITQVLYSGTQENLIKQQLILGIGGVKLFSKLGITPSVYHINEGRPAFAHWQLIRMYMDDHGMNYEEAKEAAIEKTVYTNHTLVAAGNQSYPPELIKMYSKYYANKMGISNDTLIESGLEENGQFSVTRFALNTSRKANGVSSLHTELSKKLWPQYNWVNITNGVHRGTWQHPDIQKNFHDNEKLWNTHMALKKETMQFIQKQTGFGYDERKLVLGWARRLAGYKQLPILFSDLARIKALLQNEQRPVQLLISGKAHMGDTAGKQMLQEVIELFSTELAGSALFVPNYNIEVAQHLTRGVDVWLNTPELGKEACGTSGMKATLNGVPNCTVADGWAEEVRWDGTQGWQLDHIDTANSLYTLLEQTIVPKYYSRNTHGIPVEWTSVMKNAIRLGDEYTGDRMLNQYADRLYVKTVD